MKTFCTLIILASLFFFQCSGKFNQPVIESRKAELITEGKFTFKDLNKNGSLDPYEDWRLPVQERISNLVSLMTLEEKVGLMFHPNIAVTADGAIKYDLTNEERQALAAEGKEFGSRGFLPGQVRPSATAKLYLEEKNFRCILNNGIADVRTFANWSNGMQEIAEAGRLGIPIMFSTDPRHGAVLRGHIEGQQLFSQWPSTEGQVGITATNNFDLMKKYGEVTAEEYRAVGLHMILGPQIDLITEPRWRRNFGSFSESAELTSEMLEAYMDGAQGESVGPDKILVQLKHWPGAGPHKGGAGDWLVYPGNNIDYHLIPWKKGIEKGALSVMGFYSGTFVDTLGVCYSKYFSTDVLYNQLGFKGSICSDWFVITMKGALRPDLVGNPIKDRYLMAVEAGVDQFGGETNPELIIELVNEGLIPESRIDVAASRILQWHFLLGLFEDPYVDAEKAVSVVNSKKNHELGYQAQLKSVVMLSNTGLLPYADDQSKKIFISGIDSASAAGYGVVVNNSQQADFAIIRVNSRGPAAASSTEQNLGINIELPTAAMEIIRNTAAEGIPVVVAVNLGGPLVVLPQELFDISGAVFMIFDVVDNALLDIIFGRFNPVGKLPFELPSSMQAVREQLEDVPFDTKDPLFEFGFGLSYN